MRYGMMMVAGLMAVSAPAFAATQWAVDSAASKLEWQARFNGQAVKGAFKTWTADIAFDEKDLATSKIKVDVQLGSVDSGDDDRDGTLKGADFFNVSTTPVAVFESSHIVKEGAGYVADGTLTLAGVKKGVSLPFTVVIANGKAEAQGKLTLSRKDFGVGKGQWAGSSEIGDSVDVLVHVNATAK